LIRVKKIKIKTKPSLKVTIAYEKRTKHGVWDEYSFTCSEEPRPELIKVLQDIAPHVIEMRELPETYLSRIKVTGVSFSYGGEKEVMGATIISQMELYDSNCDLNLNTPHKASEPYSDFGADEAQLLSYECVKDLMALCDEIKLYINGERAQQRLFAVN